MVTAAKAPHQLPRRRVDAAIAGLAGSSTADRPQPDGKRHIMINWTKPRPRRGPTKIPRSLLTGREDLPEYRLRD